MTLVSKSSSVAVGDRFGRWVVVQCRQRVKGKYWKVGCKCNCGYESWVRHDHLFSGRSTGCRSCTRTGANSRFWTGCGDIPGSYWHGVCQGARLRGIVVEVTLADMYALLQSQEHRCALSGFPIRFRTSRRDKDPTTASLDRIDSDVGYVRGNVQWLHKDINKMKNDIPPERFLELCRAVTFQSSPTILSLVPA